MAKQIDWLLPHNAKILADKVQQYWHDRGHLTVRVWALEGKRGTPESQPTHYVRSNLVCGMPPRGPQTGTHKIPEPRLSPLAAL